MQIKIFAAACVTALVAGGITVAAVSYHAAKVAGLKQDLGLAQAALISADKTASIGVQVVTNLQEQNDLIQKQGRINEQQLRAALRNSSACHLSADVGRVLRTSPAATPTATPPSHSQASSSANQLERGGEVSCEAVAIWGKLNEEIALLNGAQLGACQQHYKDIRAVFHE